MGEGSDRSPDRWSRRQAPAEGAAGYAVSRRALLRAAVLGGLAVTIPFPRSLKNSVGMVARSVPGSDYNYMQEPHSSSHQRRMIAEINAAHTPALVVLDGVEAFVSGGPDVGNQVRSEVVLAGTDRVAIDAVGVALLRRFGTTPEVSRGPIFQQEQIARAVELGLGVDGPERIEFVTGDPESAAYGEQLRELLRA